MQQHADPANGRREYIIALRLKSPPFAVMINPTAPIKPVTPITVLIVPLIKRRVPKRIVNKGVIEFKIPFKNYQ